MRRTMVGACLAVAGLGVALAQTPDEQMTFEVASVKPSAPMSMGPGRFMMGSRGGPGTSDPGHVTYNNLTLKSLVVTAFGVKNYQISGPSWMDSERFDITAKVPAGATKDQIKFMLQNLLKERFHMQVHRETKDLPMYAMTVGKSGPKMKESPPEEPEPADAPKASGPEDGPPKLPAMGRLKMGGDGLPELPAGFGPKKGCIMMMMMSPAGPRSHMQCKQRTMSDLAEQLSNQLDRPVTDLTGLTAKYDFNLDFAPDENRMPMMMPPGGGMATVARDGGPGPGPGPDGGPKANDTPTAPPLPAAIQEQLGLKLDAKKGPVALVVVDKIDKEPTEN